MLISLSPTLARRLAVAAQHLAGSPPPSGKNGLLKVIRRLGCIQIDPINVVTRSPLLVLWSRLGPYDTTHLQTLLWRDRDLFEYWAHAASIVLTEDYPIHQAQMRDFASGNSSWSKRVRAWMVENEPFRRYILQELAQRGPLFTDEIEDKSVIPWKSSGWTAGRNVSTMLGFLWEQGDVMVAGRSGRKKQWALAEHHLPQWATHEPLSQREVVYRAAQKSLQALGVARADHIRNHFIRGCYPSLDEVLRDLEASGRTQQVQIEENGQPWPGSWYIHTEDLPRLERLAAGEWQPATTLLSPFDNLICDRARAETLFNFSYRSEIYVPKAKRQYGYYVMPILHGERLIGRIDPKMDRKKKTLRINAVFAEPDAPMTAETAQAIAAAVASLAQFLGAKAIDYGRSIPAAWQPALR